MKLMIFSLLLLCSFGFVSGQDSIIEAVETHEYSLYKIRTGLAPITTNRADLYDSTRSRSIPIIFYHPKNDSLYPTQKLVILSHGYGNNEGKPYLGYSFIGEHLAAKGYFVVSIQHELPSDDSLAIEDSVTKNEKLRALRMPNWEKGVSNIAYTISSIRENFPEIDSTGIILIGHSNGGDMSALFAEKYPEQLEKVITLDNLRMPLPRSNSPKVLSIRSSDKQADEGVLPTSEELTQYGISVVHLSDVTHNEMCNNATPEQRAEILELIDAFLMK